MNYYAIAIGILHDVQDTMELLTEVAKRNPKAVCDAYYRLHPEKATAIDWRDKALEILRGRNGASVTKKIEAIKVCRNVTGMGLKEAKDAVEDLMAAEGLKYDGN